MKIAIKILVGISLLAILLKSVNSDKLIETISNAAIPPLIVALIFCVGASTLEVCKLYALIKSSWKFVRVLRIVFIGTFFSIFLPTSVGGDVYKIYKIKVSGLGIDKSIATVFFDRFIGLAVLVFWFCVYLLLNPSFLVDNKVEISFFHSAYKWWPIVLTVLVFVVLGLIVTSLSGVFRKQMLVLKTRIINAFIVLRQFSIQRYLLQAVLSSCYHCCRLFAIYFLIICFGGNVDWYNIIPVLTIVALISLLPITVGGIGVREGTLVGVLVFIGVGLEAATAVAIVNLSVVLLNVSVGALFFMFDKTTTTKYN